MACITRYVEKYVSIKVERSFQRSFLNRLLVINSNNIVTVVIDHKGAAIFVMHVFENLLYLSHIFATVLLSQPLNQTLKNNYII